jgi:hypothetical protein
MHGNTTISAQGVFILFWGVVATLLIVALLAVGDTHTYDWRTHFTVFVSFVYCAVCGLCTAFMQ